MNTDGFKEQNPNCETTPEILISCDSGFLVLDLLTGFVIGYGDAERASRRFGMRLGPSTQARFSSSTRGTAL